ncbi:hypothetical protein ACSLO8_26270, partial [Escherichia coli]
MKKLILAAAVAGAVLLSSAAQALTTPEGYQLQQVLMMSRHNLRAPLANNGSVLEQSTPNTVGKLPKRRVGRHHHNRAPLTMQIG